MEAQHTIFPFFEREEHGWTARCIFALYIASVEKKLGKLQCSVLRTGKDAREKQTPKGVKKNHPSEVPGAKAQAPPEAGVGLRCLRSS